MMRLLKRREITLVIIIAVLLTAVSMRAPGLLAARQPDRHPH